MSSKPSTEIPSAAVGATSTPADADGLGGAAAPADILPDTDFTNDLVLAQTAGADVALDVLLAGQAENSAEIGHADTSQADGSYDGHVALALDADILPNIDSTLDMLTTSPHLFDVPALDVTVVPDDALPT